MILLNNITICTTMESMELVFTTCTYNHQWSSIKALLCHAILSLLCTLLVYPKAIKFIFSCLNTCIHQYHDIEVKTISRSNITITINIVILCSSSCSLHNLLPINHKTVLCSDFLYTVLLQYIFLLISDD